MLMQATTMKVKHKEVIQIWLKDDKNSEAGSVSFMFSLHLVCVLQVYPSQTSILLNRCLHIVVRDHPSNSGSEMIQLHTETGSWVKTVKKEE